MDTPLQLLSLPNESLLNIIIKTSNVDLDSFASTCTTIYNLATNALQGHQKRKRQYSSITYGDPEATGDNTTWVHPTLMLRDLLTSDLMCYPTELYINDHAMEGVERNNERDVYDNEDSNYGREEDWKPRLCKIDRALKSFPQDVAPLVRACPYLNDEYEDLAGAVLGEGDIGATLGFLLTLLPNLEMIHITDYNKRSDGSRNLKTILDNVLSSSRASFRAPMSGQPLSRLVTVTFRCSDEGEHTDNWDLDTHAPFFYLPSVRTLRLRDVKAACDEWHYPGHHSSIETLDVSHCAIDLTSLKTYLKDATGLRNFRYSPNDRLVTVARTDLLSFLVEMLLEYASRTLRTLDISDYVWDYKHAGTGGYPIGSLQGFQHLETIRVHRTLEAYEHELSLHKDSPGAKLIDMLPKSAIRVVFENCSDMVRALATLEDLSGRGENMLPHLELVRFEFERYRNLGPNVLEWTQGTIHSFDEPNKEITTGVWWE